MENTQQNKKTVTYDILGISSALLCLIHCLIFPLFVLIPFSFSDDYIIDTFFACIGMFVVSKILMSNTSKTIKFILGISILFVIVSVVVEILYKTHSDLIFVGGIGMIIGHFLNFIAHKNH